MQIPLHTGVVFAKLAGGFANLVDKGAVHGQADFD